MRKTGLLLSCCLLGACTRSEGKTLFDFIQYLLQQDIWVRWIACVVLVFFLLQILRVAQYLLRMLFRFVKKSYRFLFLWGRRNLIGIALLGTILWVFSNPIIDVLQDFEQRFFSPVYVHEYGRFSEEHLTAIFEAELGKHVDPYHKAVVQRRTREMASKIQSIPLAIYEAAYLECGLKPFEVRSDHVAAGWIQFTRAGLGGLQYGGRAVTFEDVLAACRSKDINFMMDLTEQYLLRKYEKSGKKPLHNTLDLYLAIFAPALIGAPTGKVVYEGYDNPSYYKNAGLDGWYVASTPDGRSQIFHKRAACDGKITIWEIFLALEAKKNRLIATYVD